jgi:acyl-[acyl-carrier-protein]-phospholipid O-acyltransferase/long-chain-fatty-acid--[acyl-carrier-protein] ligase
MLVVISLLGLHSAAFSPAKYSIVPEIIPPADLSRANALLEMTTFLAIVLGQAGGAFLFAAWKTAVWKSSVVTLAASLAGFAASLRITRVPASGARQPLRINPFSEIAVGTKHLLRDRPLGLAVLGVSFFWFVAALLQPDLELLGDEVLHAGELRIGLLWTVLAVGLGAGNMLAGWLSGDKVELRLVPLASAFMGIFAAAVFAAGGSYPLAVTALLLLAVSSGLFVVPLYACVQQRTGAQEKGRIIATNNFYLTLGMIIASGAIWLFHDQLGVGAGRILLGFGVLTLLATACVIAILPELAVPLLPGRRAKRRSASSS